MGAVVKTNRHGSLAIRLHWTGLPKGASWEGCGLPDTPEGRTAVQAIADAITSEMKAGLFSPARYLWFFPQGNAAAHFRAEQTERTAPTIEAYAETWIERRRQERGRTLVINGYCRALKQMAGVILRLPDGRMRFGSLPLDALTTEHLTLLRAELLATRKVSSVRTYMLSALRSMLRDAREVSGWVTGDPFRQLSRWPRERAAQPDPFQATERDALLAWMRRREPWAFPYAQFLFRTGCRPSEASALRWGNVDVRAGRVRIASSRTAGEEHAPKTAASERTLALLSDVAATLRVLYPLQASGEDHVFVGQDGRAIDQNDYRTGPWRRAMRATETRPRKLYATRHTFLSLAVSAGCNMKWLSTYCGTSPVMIDRHYAMFLPPDEEQLVRLEVQHPAGVAAEAAVSR